MWSTLRFAFDPPRIRGVVATAFLVALVACSTSSSDGDDPSLNPDGSTCVDDGECSDGVCDDGACVSGCPASRVTCGEVCCGPNDVCGATGCVSIAECGQAQCGDSCCGAGETCIEGACQLACPTARCGTECCSSTETCVGGATCCDAARACGDACCAGAEVCLAGQCVVPGDACAPDRVGCATKPDDTGCPIGQTCEPTLSRCVPDRSDPTCTFTPPIGQFDPVPLFTWGRRRARMCTDAATDCQSNEVCVQGLCEVTWSHVEPGPDDLPDYFQVTSVPVVADLDGDCVPEIIFNTYRDSSFTDDGVLRAVRGDTGAKVWTVDVAEYRTDSTANPAVGDLEGDGSLEIFVAGPGKEVLAFEATGAPRWTSDTFEGPNDSGSVALANLDGDGRAEVVFGAVVFDADGKLLFEGTEGRGIGNIGPISCVADLDDDGRPELIAGRTVYAFTGSVADGTFAGAERFSAPNGVPDGYCGIADLDGDRTPEIVLVASGSVYVLSGQRSEILASLAIPGGGFGGAPNIADFDGDGRPDIGTAGQNEYVVMRYTASGELEVIWTADTEDDSSERTGSSVFDFDGDGRAEVVYNDEEFLRIYPGVEPDCRLDPPGPGCDGDMTDAEVLFRDLNSSRTRTEYPVIADVDGDFKAEIVFATSNEASFLDDALRGDAGIEVWRDRLDNWVGTPAIWNQHAYHITNITLDGRIPVLEPPSWSTPDAAPFNSYRRNAQGDRPDLCAPDLVVTEVSQQTLRCPVLAVEAEIVNQGCLGVGPGLEVSLRSTSGPVGSVRTTEALAAGAATRVLIEVSNLGDDFRFDAVVDVDADEVLNECREQNNASETLNVGCQVDL